MKRNMHQYNDRLKELIEAGASMKQIVYELKVPYYAIKDHIEYWFDVKKLVNIREKPLAKNTILSENELEVMALYNSGVSYKEISDKFNVPYQMGYQFIKYRKQKNEKD